MSRILSALKPESQVLLIEDTEMGGDQWKPEFKNGAGNSGLKISRPPADQHLTTIQIPTAVTAASFLKHTALTPAQREYLHTIASSYSTEHARSLITQHYLNVLYRCIRADYGPKGDTLLAAPVASPENDREGRQSKVQSERPSRASDASERRKVKKWTQNTNTKKKKSKKSQDQAVG